MLAALGMTGMSIYADDAPVHVLIGSWDLGHWRYMHTLPWLAVLAAGAPIYFAWRRMFPQDSRAA